MAGSISWSSYQTAVFEAVEKTSDSLIIEAVAGGAKTTTIIEAINYVPRSQSIAFLAFNKSISEELKRRITAPNCRCMTLHSAGFAAWRKFLGNEAWDCKLKSDKTRTIVSELEDSDRFKFGGQMSKLIGIAKNSGIVPHDPIGGYQALQGITKDDDEVWEDLIDFYDLDRDMCNIEVSRTVLRESIIQARETIDYDDMLFMPVITGSPFEQFDVVFIDELQDLSILQHEIVARIAKGRVIGVGDSGQAIYQWRGALSDSMARFAERFKCKSLPLSVSYRCPRSVVRKAQTWVPHIQFHESAPEGVVVEFVENWSVGDFLPTDVILCRNSKPLIETAFLLIRNKVPCRVLGRDIGQGLVSLVKKMKAYSVEDLEHKLEAYRIKEVRRAKEDEAKISALDDKLSTLDVFINELADDATIEGLIRSIEALFSDDGNSRSILTLSTVHKSKGLQFPRVFILDAHRYMPSKWARQPWQQQGERNVHYVAVTRAMSELYYISSKSLRELARAAVPVAKPSVVTEDVDF